MIRYNFDAKRSRVWIDARSNVHPIHTEASGIKGWLELDGRGGQIDFDRPHGGHLEFPVVNLKSGNVFENRELQRRIDGRRFPTITGDLNLMTAGTHRGLLRVNGDVTFRGVTRTYEEDMTMDGFDTDGSLGRTVTLRGEATFDIRDFGMEPPKVLLLRVQPDVTVRVELVAVKDD